MKPIRICVTALFLFAVALTSSAALSKEYADFPKGPADLLMTNEERKQWKSIKTDTEAKEFIDLFWARRDPTPATPANEFRNGFEERVKIAETRFHSTHSSGSRSDRGKVFILMGSPTKIRRSQAEPQSTILTPGQAMSAPVDRGGLQSYSPKEVWEYEQAKTPITLGQPLVRIAFIDQYATNDWKMERIVDTDYKSVFHSIATAFVAQPDLREVPTFEVAAAPPAPVAAPKPATELASDAFRDAIEKARSAEPQNVFVTYGEFITPAGEHFVPVQLYVPGSTETQATFFGVVEKAEGGDKVAAFEEPVTLTATKDGSFYARSLTLPPGQYRGSFGLAKDGKPIGVVSTPMTVAGLDKDATAVSSLMLSNNIYPLSEAQQATDPFAFGGLKVVPKSDATFKRSDELWYFFEARNPGLDPASNQPKLSVKLSLTGTAADGKPVKMNAPVEITPGQELKGVPGHWAVGQAMPLQTFKPGSYKLAVKVTDLVSNQTWDLEGSFRIVE